MLAAHFHYAQMEPLRTCLWAEMGDNINPGQDKLHADRGERKADMRAFNEMIERREAE
jgi:hypothetical protein